MAATACEPADVPDDHESRLSLSFFKAAARLESDAARWDGERGVGEKMLAQKQWLCVKGVWRPAGGVWRPAGGVASVFSPIDFGSR